MSNEVFDLAAQRISLDEKRWNGFVPASIGVGTTFRHEYKGCITNWWEDKSFFTYPLMLNNVTMLAAAHKKEDIFKEELNIGNSVLFTDSGGFQLESYERGMRKGKVDINATMAIDLMYKIGTTVGFVLDYPDTTTDMLDFDSLKKKAVWTQANNYIYQEYMAKNGKKEGLNIYNVIHGFNEEEFADWFDTVDVVKFDGWAYGPKSGSKVFDVLAGIGYLYERGIRKNCHILGVSGQNEVALLTYINLKYIDNLTFDSSSFGVGNRFRSYLQPNTDSLFTKKIDFGRSYTGKISDFILTCSCPVCSIVKSSKVFEEDNGTLGGMLISLHNLYQYIIWVGYLIREYNKGEESFRASVKRSCGEIALIGMDFFDEVVSSGYTVARSKYTRCFKDVSRGKELSFIDLVNCDSSSTTVHHSLLKDKIFANKEDNMVETMQQDMKCKFLRKKFQPKKVEQITIEKEVKKITGKEVKKITGKEVKKAIKKVIPETEIIPIIFENGLICFKNHQYNEDCIGICNLVDKCLILS